MRNLTFDGSTLTVSGDLDPTNVSIGGTLQVTGVATFLSGTLVSGIARLRVILKLVLLYTIKWCSLIRWYVTANDLHLNGNASFSGIVTVGGNLNVTSDYS